MKNLGPDQDQQIFENLGPSRTDRSPDPVDRRSLDRQLNILEVREEGVHVFYVKSTEEVSLTLDYVKDVVAAFKRDLQANEMSSQQ